VLLWRGDWRTFTAVAGVQAWLLGSGLCVYALIARTPPLIDGGRGVLKYEKYRHALWVTLAVLLLVAVSIMGWRSSRAFLGNALKPEGTTDTTPVVVVRPSVTPSLANTPILPSPTVPAAPVFGRLGTCEFGTWEGKLVDGPTIYSHQEDSFYFTITKGIVLSSGERLNSLMLGRILEQHEEALQPFGYKSWEPSGEFRIRVFVNDRDSLFDPDQRLLCALATIPVPLRPGWNTQ